VHVPKAWQRRRQLEVAAEAPEARLMRETVDHQAHLLLERLPGCRRANVEPLAVPALLAAHIDEHWQEGEMQCVQRERYAEREVGYRGFN